MLENIETIIYHVTPERINIVQAIFESYEGVASVRTLNPAIGEIEIMTPEANLDLVDEILRSLINSEALGYAKKII